jgi:hypothetical protein
METSLDTKRRSHDSGKGLQGSVCVINLCQYVMTIKIHFQTDDVLITDQVEIRSGELGLRVWGSPDCLTLHLVIGIVNILSRDLVRLLASNL